nr:MAG TPA: hypothetical protein [Caudoviricetes sp.]
MLIRYLWAVLTSLFWDLRENTLVLIWLILLEELNSLQRLLLLSLMENQNFNLVQELLI